MPAYTLRQLAYFVAVAHAGSIAGAARSLHVTPTAVASALSDLERSLRTQLLVRRKAHGVTLTPTGVYLRERAARLLEEADELELSATNGGRDLRGPLTLGCYVTLSPTVAPLLRQWFSDHHPGVELTFVVGNQRDLPARLLKGAMDLAIVFDIDLPAGLDSVQLYSIPPYAALSAAHPLARDGAVSLAELASEPLILLDVPPAAAHTLALFDAAGVQPRIVQRTSDFELTRSLVARGLGYSLLFQRPAGDMSYEGLPLVARDLTPAVAGLGVRMIWPSATRLTDRARAMVAFASTNARQTDPHGRVG